MYNTIAKQMEKTGKAVTVTVISGEYIGSKLLLDEDRNVLGSYGSWPDELKTKLLESISGLNETCTGSCEGTDYIFEITHDIPRMVILGGGHVAMNVGRIAPYMGYHVTVVDDREQFASEDRFPGAHKRICKPFREAFDEIPDLENTYYVIVTKGHAFDGYCLKRVLKRKFAYCGMMGSKSKVGYLVKEAIEDGCLPEKAALVHTPIGLKLGGHIPMEVAVSICAEITMIRNEKPVHDIDADVRHYLLAHDTVDGIMATIVGKKGTSPRNIGDKMLIFPDGSILGSIGGGMTEFKAMKEGVDVKEAKIASYGLPVKEGMDAHICGGEITVLFEPLGA